MTDEIEQVRKALDIEREVQTAASDWKDERGGDRVGRCTHPTHGHTSSNSDGTRNMIVTDDGGWYCYSHGKGGGIFEWVAVDEGICDCRNLPLSDDEFVKALDAAADRAGIDLSPSAEDVEEMSDEARARHALDKAIDILHDNLSSVVGDHTVRGIIKQNRGFDDDEIDEARIGYLDDTAHHDLLEELTPQELQDIGLYRDNKSLHVNNRIIYPYLEGRLPTYWIGRRTEESPGEAKYRKPSSDSVFEQPIYRYSPTGGSVSEELWVTEGIQDAISLAEAGGVETASAVATNPSSKQLEQLSDRAETHGTAVVCFDNDEAGLQKAIDLATTLMSRGIQTKMATVPDGEDPNDYFKAGGSFEEIDTALAAVKVVREKGAEPPVIRRMLSTVEPDTLRADNVVNQLAEETGWKKKNLRKELRKGYREEQQAGWMEPIRITKTSGADPDYTFHYPNGKEVEMDQIGGRRVEQKFAEKYAKKFNYVPNFSPDEWTELVNEWLRTVEVVEEDPLSIEVQIRESVLNNITTANLSQSRSVAAQENAYPGTIEDGDLLIPTTVMKGWIDDTGYDVSMRKVSTYLDPITAENTKLLSADGRKVRFWVFDVEQIEDRGYTVPEPEPAEDTVEVSE